MNQLLPASQHFPWNYHQTESRLRQLNLCNRAELAPGKALPSRQGSGRGRRRTRLYCGSCHVGRPSPAAPKGWHTAASERCEKQHCGWAGQDGPWAPQVPDFVLSWSKRPIGLKQSLTDSLPPQLCLQAGKRKYHSFSKYWPRACVHKALF